MKVTSERHRCHPRERAYAGPTWRAVTIRVVDDSPTNPPLAVVILAAGGGTRFSATRPDGAADPGHKLLADLGGRAVVAHAIAHAVEAAVGPVVVVTGAVPIELPPGVIEAHHAGWALGQAGSLHRGLAVAESLGARAVVVGLGDQPGVPAAAWQLVALAPPEWQLVVASYDGRRGPNPVRLPRSLWAEVPTTGDEGARSLLRRHSELVHEVPCPGSAHDIDTLEDLQRWTSS